MWKRIPHEVKDEINLVRNYTQKSGKEGSITFCTKPGKKKLFIGNNFKGTRASTIIGECSEEFGASNRIGDLHSHPYDSDTIGNIHSEQDLVTNLEFSKESKRQQISCVVVPRGKIVRCMEPKLEAVTNKKINRYRKAASDRMLVSPYVVDNVNNDFDISMFDVRSGKHLRKPNPKDVIDSALGGSKRPLKRSLHQMKHGPFCNFIQQMTNKNDDRISKECKAELKRKGVLDILGL